MIAIHPAFCLCAGLDGELAHFALPDLKNAVALLRKGVPSGMKSLFGRLRNGHESRGI